MLYQLKLVESMLIEFATKNLSLRAKNVSKYTSNGEDARVIIACYYFEAKIKV